LISSVVAALCTPNISYAFIPLALALVDAIARFGASISADSETKKRGPAHDDARHGATERASDRERGRQARTRVER
jgi:hypothetical protein